MWNISLTRHTAKTNIDAYLLGRIQIKYDWTYLHVRLNGKYPRSRTWKRKLINCKTLQVYRNDMHIHTHTYKFAAQPLLCMLNNAPYAKRKCYNNRVSRSFDGISSVLNLFWSNLKLHILRLLHMVLMKTSFPDLRYW